MAENGKILGKTEAKSEPKKSEAKPTTPAPAAKEKAKVAS